ncbi:uncharacterized protein LOC116332192 isoform X6 [Oreochromis aureus]|uniref:uncharacterized protein LOC116332192 isoform X6 n=1 Tax=Oreochromis aureus TaxID=47969 RepID=UPI0019547AEE|nr:uncharacterized protein LOC116332192 isoform X6 [Oreochromis aureus]
MFSPAGARSSTQPGSRSGTARYKSSSRFSTLPSTFSFLSGRLEDSRNSFPAAAACKLSSQSCSFCWFFSGYLRRCPTFKMKGVPIQLMIRSSKPTVVELTFLEHRQCECRKPDNLQYYERSVINSSSSKSIESRPRRRKQTKKWL